MVCDDDTSVGKDDVTITVKNVNPEPELPPEQWPGHIVILEVESRREV